MLVSSCSIHILFEVWTCDLAMLSCQNLLRCYHVGFLMLDSYIIWGVNLWFGNVIMSKCYQNSLLNMVLHSDIQGSVSTGTEPKEPVPPVPSLLERVCDPSPGRPGHPNLARPAQVGLKCCNLTCLCTWTEWARRKRERVCEKDRKQIRLPSTATR
jgi:hypothetical protein